MCDSCPVSGLNRRHFLAAGGAAGAAGLLSTMLPAELSAAFNAPRPAAAKEPARVRVAFLYPPADVVNEGQLEDSWRGHHWFTWPGNQFEPEQQERTFTQKIREIAESLGIHIEFAPRAIYQEAKVREFVQQAQASPLDAVLIVNFWNSFSKWSWQMATESAPTAIVYHSVGSNHQLPPEYLRTAEGIYYIHSIQNWQEIERGLRAVHAKKMLSQSRLLRVSGRLESQAHDTEKTLGVDIVGVPADDYNTLFDSIAPDDVLTQEAMAFKKLATRVLGVEDKYFVDAMRAHRTVSQMLERHGADAITIDCLFLKHRKPCVSFAINNGELVPCGCENHLDGALSLMAGRWLLERAGFLHNPEFDTSENHYFGAHCTCAWKLHGPDGSAQPFWIRPFFHQLPKTPALDVQWTPGEPVLLTKYLSGQDKLSCWSGKVLSSPTSPPTGGCATRVLVQIDDVTDVCDIYSGPHPILFCGDRKDAQQIKAFAQMYRLQLEGNV